MIDTKQIKWANSCVDPGTRLFFVGNRVFRAYRASRKQEALDFLQSECYSILREKRMIVNTWVTYDVQVDDYALVLEHERLSCVPEEWMCFEQLKEILAFHFEVEDFCKKYGYGLRDIGFGNVTMNKGQYCFIDFGSFRKRENIYTDIYSIVGYFASPLVLYQANNGCEFLADKLISEYFSWELEASKPFHFDGIDDILRPYLKPIISSYKLRLSYLHWSWTTHMHCTISIINWINRTATKILHKPNRWKLIKIQNVYTEQKSKKWIKELVNPYENDNVEILKKYEAVINVVKNRQNEAKRIILWGNFALDDIVRIKDGYSGELIIMTNDRMYANSIYKEILEKKIDVVVYQTNAIAGRNPHLLELLKTDIIVFVGTIYESTYAEPNGEHYEWGERLAYMAKCLITTPIPMKDIELSRLTDYFDITKENGSQVFCRRTK